MQGEARGEYEGQGIQSNIVIQKNDGIFSFSQAWGKEKKLRLRRESNP